MKINRSPKTDRLYCFARFESFHVCDFSKGTTDALMGGSYTKRLSAGDAGCQRYYVLARVTGVLAIYLDGKLIGPLTFLGDVLTFDMIHEAVKSLPVS